MGVCLLPPSKLVSAHPCGSSAMSAACRKNCLPSGPDFTVTTSAESNAASAISRLKTL